MLGALSARKEYCLKWEAQARTKPCMEVPVSAAGHVLEQYKQVIALQSPSQHV